MSKKMSKKLNMNEAEELQIRDSMRAFNNLVAMCFDTCVYNFKTRKIDNSEELCLNRCAQKYMQLVQRIGQVFFEQQLLTLQQQQQQQQQQSSQ
jgi:hypothetical protein